MSWGCPSFWAWTMYTRIYRGTFQATMTVSKSTHGRPGDFESYRKVCDCCYEIKPRALERYGNFGLNLAGPSSLSSA